MASAAVVGLGLAIAPVFASDVYVIDKTRSEATIAIRHILSTVAGRAKDVSGVINVDARNPTASYVNFPVEIGSIETGSSEHNHALGSAALLDVAKYPQIIFQSG